MHSVGSMGGGSSGSQTATRGGHTMPVGGVGGGGSIGGGSGGGGSGGGGSGGVEAEKRSNDHQSGGKQPEISQASMQMRMCVKPPIIELHTASTLLHHFYLTIHRLLCTQRISTVTHKICFFPLAPSAYVT